jgi:hypothetical protein
MSPPGALAPALRSLIWKGANSRFIFFAPTLCAKAVVIFHGCGGAIPVNQICDFRAIGYVPHVAQGEFCSSYRCPNQLPKNLSRRRESCARPG